MYGNSVCMYSVPWTCMVPMEALDPLLLELQTVVSSHVVAGTWVYWKNSQAEPSLQLT